MITSRERSGKKSESRTGGRKPVYYSVVIHVILLILLGISVRWSWKDDTSGVMKARVIDNKPAQKKTIIKPEKKKQVKTEKKDKKKADQKKLEQKKKQQAALKLKKADDRKRAAKKKRQQEAEARKLAAEQSLQESLIAEEAERVEAERQARANEFADKYRAIIRQKVSRNWVKPGGSRKGLKVIVRVRLLASGDVLEVSIIKSSGDALFDRSVENAVRKASPLPIPQEKDLFDYFREIEFLFNPEDNSR